MARRLEVRCGWCGKRFTIKTLAKELYCCKVSYGPRCLIKKMEEGGKTWFEATTGTEVRVFTKEEA